MTAITLAQADRLIDAILARGASWSSPGAR